MTYSSSGATSIRVSKVENGFVIKPGTGKEIVCESLDCDKLAAVLRKAFGLKKEGE